MFDFFRKLLSTEFMPHGMCYLWDPAVLWLNATSDLLITAAYYAIPFLLFYFVRKRRDIEFSVIFIAFGIFIFACGTTHLMSAITIWHPYYRLDGVIKAITAVASVATFIMLVPMMPTLIALPSPSQLEKVNRSLAGEIEERRVAEAEVRKMNEQLEDRVAKRTAERQSLESQLIQSQKMEAVGRLAGGVAHDFNNLLTVILGYTEMIRDHIAQDSQALEFADEIHLAAHRASDLTNQLLAFSRRQMAMPRVVSLNDVVHQIENMLARIIGEDIQLETRLVPDILPVRVDPSHMQQVIMNLAVNSRDAMPKGGKLTIETANVELTSECAGRHIGVAGGRYTLLAVSDTGTGMDEATQAQLFEPFFTTKARGKGTGLGLSIVYGIVKQNGGEIVVYSEPGHGTAFKIYLPVVAGTAETLSEPWELEEPAPGVETVLLVEDDQQVRSLTRTILTVRGYQVIDAASPAAALRVVADPERTIDLLLTDIVMPGMNGPELARQVLTARPGIRVLFMSGYTDGGVIDHGVLSSETSFIQKPFTSAALNRKIREVLREGPDGATGLPPNKA
ncbi:MAG: integral rane sensor hybrid histidine kinase [Candidatus Solibacter sp.]|nr:integral rane sensor hybrid histidine kinase [Candidatus Solibacter sp.]